jgi:hypothetical protein
VPLIIAFVFFLCSCAPWACEAATIGVHLHSIHTLQKEETNQNTGAYVRTVDGWTAGFYRSSMSGAPEPKLKRPPVDLDPVNPAAPLHLPTYTWEERLKDQPEHYVTYFGHTSTLWQTSNGLRVELTAGILTGYRYSALRYMPFAAPSAVWHGVRLTVLPASHNRSGVVHVSFEVDTAR